MFVIKDAAQGLYLTAELTWAGCRCSAAEYATEEEAVAVAQANGIDVSWVVPA